VTDFPDDLLLESAPTSWRVTSLSRIARLISGGTPPSNDPAYWKRDLPWVSPKDMRTHSISDSEDWVAERAVRDGRTTAVESGSLLVVVRSGILRRTIPTARTTRRVAINQDIKGLTLADSCLPEFLLYWVGGNEMVLLDLWRKPGATVESLEIPRIVKTRIALPPLDEQRAIARFLDRKSRRIARFIRARQRMIALLNEQKQAIIHQAVTRGLDPDVPLKPSSIDWLGDIPAHWAVKRAGYVLRKIDQRSPAGAETHLSMSQKLGLLPAKDLDQKHTV